MKKLLRRILSGVLSLVTTCLIMVSPVAALVYAAEPVEAVESFGITDVMYYDYIAREKPVIDKHREPGSKEPGKPDSSSLTEKE